MQLFLLRLRSLPWTNLKEEMLLICKKEGLFGFDGTIRRSFKFSSNYQFMVTHEHTMDSVEIWLEINDDLFCALNKEHEDAMRRKNFTGTSAIAKEIKGSYQLTMKCFCPGQYRAVKEETILSLDLRKSGAVQSWKALVSSVVCRVLCYVPWGITKCIKKTRSTRRNGHDRLNNDQNVPAYGQAGGRQASEWHDRCSTEAL